MNYQVLARKWRPKKFQDVLGQEHIARSLQNSILRSEIGHAYLFVGTRGVGKTSVARIFAKAVRCVHPQADGNACLECAACLDFDNDSSLNVVEIDGASNNSVDNIRDIVSNVQYLPTSGKFKVYIIDEVHMLSSAAFNALLKTLEEPPRHVVFILATTEPQKLLGTVLSRCQRFDFRNVSQQELVGHIKKIASAEEIVFESERIMFTLASLGKGSVRDTLSLLDQVLSFSVNKKVDESVMTLALGIAKQSVIANLSKAIFSGDDQSTSSLYRGLLSENVLLKNIVLGLLDYWYELLNSKDYQSFSIDHAEMFWIYESLTKDAQWALESLDPEKVVEIILKKITLRRTFFNQEVKKKITEQEDVELLLKIDPFKKEQEQLAQEVTNPEGDVIPLEDTKAIAPDLAPQDEEVVKLPPPLDWEKFLAFLIQKSPASASNLEQGNLIEPLAFLDSKLVVKMGFPASGKVFYDFLLEPEIYQKLVKNMADYFQITTAQVNLELQIMHIDSNFKSTAEIKEQNEVDLKNAMVEMLKNDPLIREAEKIFNSKIDKVIIDKK